MKGKYVKEVRKIDKIWIVLRLFAYALMLIGGILIATFLYQGYLEELLQARPIAVYIVPILFIVAGIILGVLAEKRIEKTETSSGGKGGGYK